MLKDFFFPRRCPVCDRPVKPFGALICTACENKIKYVAPPYCLKCGKSVAPDAGAYCFDCTLRKHGFDQAVSLFDYKSVAMSLYRFKYKGRREYADYYGERLATVLGKQILSWKPQAIIPVPIHASKRRMRGYNQAELVARSLSGYLSVPVETEWIKRCKKTVPLKDLSPLERQNNLKKAFIMRCNDVKLDTIVILDDIYTTGSTVDEMARLLRANGVFKIYVVTLAIGRGI